MTTTQNYQLIFVDDNTDFLTSIQTLLDETEFRSTKISTCSTYEEAFSAASSTAKSDTPICFIDLSVLVEGDGFFIIEEIRKIREDSYFVLLTGDKRASIVQQSIEYGCLSHVIKSTVSSAEELGIVLANVFTRVSTEERTAFSRALRDIQISTQSFIHDVEKYLDNTITSLNEAKKSRRNESHVDTALQNAESVHRIFDNYKVNIAVLNRNPKISLVGTEAMYEDLQRICETLGLSYSPISISNSKLIQTDREILFRALTNIAENAKKFTRHGTTPIVRAEQNQGSVDIAFEDFGPGISENYPGQILEYGKKGSNNSGARGMGLGLWFTKEVLEKMCQNGAEHSLRYSNKEKSAGAIFTIIIPLHPLDM